MTSDTIKSRKGRGSALNGVWQGYAGKDAGIPGLHAAYRVKTYRLNSVRMATCVAMHAFKRSV
ncbi:hypothetical protein KOSB73_260044 [Klebsiella grimontii]|uniref:Uncharacterized protein n=1 Tax=Klebsiella grimontii TaxID=2058152 RepID=A0A285B319_9ENTR|nr:hypothetical protein KOSB73_260044 [Klebsiella grimontii]